MKTSNKITKFIRLLLVTPLLFLGYMSFILAEFVSGEKFTFRADDVREDTIKKLKLKK